MRKKMPDYRDYLIERLRNDTEEAFLYLETALEEFEQDGDKAAFLLALRTVAEAKGGLTKLSQETKLNRQNLYRSLSSKGNPTLSTLDTVLKSLGYRLSLAKLEIETPVSA